MTGQAALFLRGIGMRLVNEGREATAFGFRRGGQPVNLPAIAPKRLDAMAFHAFTRSALPRQMVKYLRSWAGTTFLRIWTGQIQPGTNKRVLVSNRSVEYREILAIPSAILTPALRIDRAFCWRDCRRNLLGHDRRK